MTSAHRVVIVGAGFSGIGMAARLRVMGIDDFVVLDRGNDLGGTWRDNSYPGAACDVPSNLYSFSFALNPDWSSAFPSQAEIWDYMRACVDRFDVGDRLRFDHSVTEARWDADAERWHVFAAGEEYVAEVLVWATGSLSEPQVPQFPGLEGFRGKVFHSAKWEHGFDLKGKRVCVVGTGASAIQFVPQIAPNVEHLYLHQRTPPWIVPRRDRRVSRLRKLAYRKLPALQRLSRLRIYATFEALLAVFVGHSDRPKGLVAQRALDHLRRQVPDETLRAKLTPHYQPGLQAPAALGRLLPVAHPAQRGGRRLAGRLVHRPRGGGPGRHRPPRRRRHHGHRVRGRRAALRRTHRRPRRRPPLRALEGRRRRGLRRLDGGRLPEPLPNDRAELDARPQLDDLHDRVAHQLHRQRAGVHGAARRADGRGQAGRAAALQRPPAGAGSSTRCGWRAAAAAGTWTTGAATRRCGPTTPGSSAG